MQRQLRALAVHDISCFGRCSLTVALPILSAAGIEASAMPTAVLSTHTGGFEGYTFRDLTGDLMPIARHWQSLGLKFDAVYTGYLGSLEQVGIVSEIIGMLAAEGALVLVDPVMGDNGKLYDAFGPGFPKAMAGLCARAGVIAPNLTEAALLLGDEPGPGPKGEGEALELAKRLCGLGAKKVVVTGASFAEGRVGAYCYDSESGEGSYCDRGLVEPMCHGTGDVFASVLAAALLSGCGLAQACRAAVEYTADSVERTKAEAIDSRFGVDFERGLASLARLIEECRAA
jgi:pyridoxine kinase